MRALFTFAGGAGHLNPLLPVAEAVRAAGHDAAFSGKPSVVAHAERAGYTVFGTGAENDAGRDERGRLEPIDREREQRMLRDGFAGRIAVRRLTELLEVADGWRPDLFVCDETDFGGTLAAERLGLPHVTVLVNASGSFVRGDLLAGTFDVELLSRHLVLNPFPPSFRDPSHPLPETARGIRLLDAPPSSGRRERPRVYFTLGTIFDLESGDLYERVLEALGMLPLDAVTTIGRRLDPAALEPPPNVTVVQYVPQEQLLADCDAMVTHGGSGSLLGAFAFGLPVVVLPLGADQPWNADRCAATGVGRVLDAASATPHEIAAAVSSVLAEPAYRTAAERLRQELSSFAPPSAAVALLEGCVQAKRVAFSSMSRPLPSGTVTFVFTDIEGSTRLLQELGEAYAAVSRDHRQLVRAAFVAHDGTEIDTQGDSFFFSFTRARDAVAAAVEAQRALAAHSWPEAKAVRVRMGLHTGEPTVGDEGYLGLDVVRAARISAAGHGGQILLSETTRALVGNDLPSGVAVHDLGEQNLKDIQHERVYELSLDGQRAETRPLKTHAVDNRVDAMAQRFEERVTSYVEQQLEAAFTKGKPPDVPVRLAARGLGIAGLALLMMIGVIVVAILALRWLFF